MALIYDTDLVDVLASADAEDLSILFDHITDKGEGRLSLSSEVCKKLHDARVAGEFPAEIRTLAAEELQRFGGNSIVNLIRGGTGVPYSEIARDVADHVKAKYPANADCAAVEMAILLKVLEQAYEQMTEEEKRKLFEEFGAFYKGEGAGPASMATLIAAIKLSGFGVYKLAAVVANAVARALLGRGLSFGAAATMMRGISFFSGPVGWAVTAIWTAFDLASPAYRVTVPCVVQIAYMRQKRLSQRCSTCSAPLQAEAKFCSECGARVGVPALAAP
jgi:uncharacterized protein YaaW (UPF0174 family)